MLDAHLRFERDEVVLTKKPPTTENSNDVRVRAMNPYGAHAWLFKNLK